VIYKNWICLFVVGEHLCDWQQNWPWLASAQSSSVGVSWGLGTSPSLLPAVGRTRVEAYGYLATSEQSCPSLLSSFPLPRAVKHAEV
jgi:hypothetical protein